MLLWVNVDGWPWAVYLAVKSATGKLFTKHPLYYAVEGREGGKLYGEAIGWAMLAVDTPCTARQGYEGVLEHVVVRFVAKCSRICSHELVRHRIASYAQTSTRLGGAHAEGYREMVEKLCEKLDESMFMHAGSGEAIALTSTAEALLETLCILPDEEPYRDHLIRQCLAHFRAVCGHLRHGKTVEIDRLLRYGQPDALAAHVMVTTNLRELLHILQLRLHPRAHWEIRRLASKLADRLWADYKIPVHLMLLLKRPGITPIVWKKAVEQLEWLRGVNNDVAKQVEALLTSCTPGRNY